MFLPLDLTPAAEEMQARLMTSIELNVSGLELWKGRKRYKIMDWTKHDLEVIERCRGEAGEIQLQRRGAEYEIIYNGIFLMATYNGESEKTAVREALKNITAWNKGPVNVLMGGLGVGYSLREALDWKQVNRVVVIEIEPAVISWNRGILARVNGWALSDQRVEIINGDFVEVLKYLAAAAAGDPSEAFGVVVADIDNGSGWLSLPANAYLYREEGLGFIKQCLIPGGAACFWCPDRETVFEKRLSKIYSEVHFNRIMEKTGKEGAYYLAVN